MFKFKTAQSDKIWTEVEADSLEDAKTKLVALEADQACLGSFNGETIQVNHFDVNGDVIEVVEV